MLSEVTGTIVENEIFFSVSHFDIHFSEGRLLFRGAGHEDRDAEFTFTKVVLTVGRIEVAFRDSIQKTTR